MTSPKRDFSPSFTELASGRPRKKLPLNPVGRRTRLIHLLGCISGTATPTLPSRSGGLTHRERFHQSRLVESVLPSGLQYQDTLHRLTDYFVAQGNSLLQAQQQATQWIGQ